MEYQRWQKTSPQQKWVGFFGTDWSIDRSIWLIRAQWVREWVSDWVIVKYSHLSPCGHSTITDTPIIRTTAKSQVKINLISLIFAMQKVLFWFQFCFVFYRVCFRSQNVYSLEFYYQVKLYSFFAFKVWVFLHIQCLTSPRQTSQRMTQASRALTSHGSLFHLITWMGFYWTITWYTAELINLKTTSPWLLWTAPFYTQNFQD